MPSPNAKPLTDNASAARALIVAYRPRARRHGQGGRQVGPRADGALDGRGDNGFVGHDR